MKQGALRAITMSAVFGLVMAVSNPGVSATPGEDGVVAPGEVDPNGEQTDPNAGPAPEPSEAERRAEAARDRSLYGRLQQASGEGASQELVWSLDAPGSDGRRRGGSATDLTTQMNTDENIPYAGWAACGATDDRFKVVHDYDRMTVHWRQERTYARLYCGLFVDDGATHAFGYRHILDRHAGDWQRKADYIRRNWRDLAGWAMQHTFWRPDRITISDTRFCYQRRFYLYYGDTKVSEMTAIFYLGETAVRIMTAIPTSGTSYNCSGTQI